MTNPVFLRSACVVAIALSLSGCATSFHLSFGTPVEYETEIDGAPTVNGTPLVLARRSPSTVALGWQNVGLYLGTGIVSSNLLLATAKFQNNEAMVQWVAATLGMAIIGDYLANSHFGVGRPISATPRSVVLTESDLEVPIVSLGVERFRVAMPPVHMSGGETANLKLLGEQGQVVGQAFWKVPSFATLNGVKPSGTSSAHESAFGAPEAARSMPPKPAGNSGQTLAKRPLTSQNAASGTRTSAKKIEPGAVVPPMLSTKVGLEEPVGDGAVHAGEGGTLVVTVTNVGKSRAFGVIANLRIVTATQGLTVPSSVPFGDLEPGASRDIRIPVGAERGLRAGRASVQVIVEDVNRYDAPPARLAFDLRAYEVARLVIDQVGATGTSSEGVPRRGEQIDLKVLVKNTSGMPARGVVAELLRRHPDLIAAGVERVEIGDIPAGSWKIAHFSLFVRNSYTGPATLPIAVRLSEIRSTANQDVSIAVTLDKASPDVVEFFARAPKGADSAVQELPELTVDVDQPLKFPVRPDRDAVALVIGIERYRSQVPPVAFAQRDAQSMKRYFRDVLGVEEENFVTIIDDAATKAGIQVAVERKLKNLITPGKSNVYVYYAGHGAPDAATKSAFLVPFDGDPNYPAETCYPTAKLYEALGALGAKNVTVMLDACFSGQDGRNKEPQLLIAGTRPLLINPLPDEAPAGITVFAAAGPSQVSSAYPEKRHGLFTYFILKALRGDDLPPGGLTVKKLQNYLAEQVSRRARRMGREQNPQLLNLRGEDRPIKD